MSIKTILIRHDHLTSTYSVFWQVSSYALKWSCLTTNIENIIDRTANSNWCGCLLRDSLKRCSTVLCITFIPWKFINQKCFRYLTKTVYSIYHTLISMDQEEFSNFVLCRLCLPILQFWGKKDFSSWKREVGKEVKEREESAAFYTRLFSVVPPKKQSSKRRWGSYLAIRR